jgi:hypothetical protein
MSAHGIMLDGLTGGLMEGNLGEISGKRNAAPGI